MPPLGLTVLSMNGHYYITIAMLQMKKQTAREVSLALGHLGMKHRGGGAPGGSEAAWFLLA